MSRSVRARMASCARLRLVPPRRFRIPNGCRDAEAGHGSGPQAAMPHARGSPAAPMPRHERPFAFTFQEFLTMIFKQSMSRLAATAPAVLSALSLSFLFAACDVSDPHEHDEGELITSLRLVLTHDASGTADTVWFRDPDGPGGSAPVAHDTLRLTAGRAYNVALAFLDESSPAHVIDMTDELREEAVDPQVFYTVTGPGLTVAYADEDDNGFPVGLAAVFTTTSGTPGALTITLKHQPGLK